VHDMTFEFRCEWLKCTEANVQRSAPQISTPRREFADRISGVKCKPAVGAAIAPGLLANTV